ncbi:adenosylmethionine--8-amino-7-oxononanoate aminotransferase BioA [Shewanella sairae]|uniref:Adenosylmethionine-8-amino-7-oxononanoate aminotransferase n=1 Tax=Shewanella sairae TaxID=190310 RepID=A0ABQ4PRI7_9GAMM|nr:adenosylmethionine--8-amino-7-oxononanoate transaminase [Shewanella sairae]MCL1129484.1 adenosylmethionine--8-amino-7-oxononanoate transaminase [Shewanella sairae]GIU52241.1 adenosylmethionine--8-amino-7-oxononanoate aminotransferase BioA [Shewanella sairae]
MNTQSQSTINSIDLQFDRKHLWHPYTSMANALPAYGVVAAEGVELQLQDGSKLIDGTSSWWACVHGYSHPKIVAAMQQQTAKLSHVMFGGITHRPAVELARLLVELTSPKLTKVFLADSGSIAVEVAMKMALQYWQGKANTDKQKILTIKNGYHGDTFAAMSVCDPEGGMHTMFGELVTKQLFAPAPQSRFDGEFDPEELNEIASIFEDNHQQIAALLVEPIMQGAGGMRFYHSDYLAALRKLCDKYNVLLILDEIATGFGRTGKLFAYEHSQIEADILCLGKALTGGYISLAATMCSDEVAQGVSDSPAGVFMHGPTFMGNPLACAAAIASIELIKENQWQTQVSAIETQLKTELADAINYEHVNDVRVLGAVGVLEMSSTLNTAELQQEFVNLGVWIRPFSNLIYIMPPYCVTAEQLSKLTHAMKTVAANINPSTNDIAFISHG